MSVIDPQLVLQELGFTDNVQKAYGSRDIKELTDLIQQYKITPSKLTVIKTHKQQHIQNNVVQLHTLDSDIIGHMNKIIENTPPADKIKTNQLFDGLKGELFKLQLNAILINCKALASIPAEPPKPADPTGPTGQTKPTGPTPEMFEKLIGALTTKIRTVNLIHSAKVDNPLVFQDPKVSPPVQQQGPTTNPPVRQQGPTTNPPVRQQGPTTNPLVRQQGPTTNPPVRQQGGDNFLNKYIKYKIKYMNTKT
jgi:hypothetical protein